jgi:hypothetical protein
VHPLKVQRRDTNGQGMFRRTARESPDKRRSDETFEQLLPVATHLLCARAHHRFNRRFVVESVAVPAVV